MLSKILRCPSISKPPGMTCHLIGPRHSNQKSVLAHALFKDICERPVYQLGEERAGDCWNKQCSTRNPMWGCILLHFVEFRQLEFCLGGYQQGLTDRAVGRGVKRALRGQKSILGNMTSNCWVIIACPVGGFIVWFLLFCFVFQRSTEPCVFFLKNILPL